MIEYISMLGPCCVFYHVKCKNVRMVVCLVCETECDVMLVFKHLHYSDRPAEQEQLVAGIDFTNLPQLQ